MSLQVTVILENMFHPEELLEEASLLKDLESDIYTECGKMGPIDKVESAARHSLCSPGKQKEFA